MKRTLFFLLSFILLCSSKCKEDPLPNPDPTPNPTTEEPTGEISCLINGKEWKTGPPFLLSNPKTEVVIQKIVGENKYSLSIYANKRDEKNNVDEVLQLYSPNYLIGTANDLTVSLVDFTKYKPTGVGYKTLHGLPISLKILSIDTLKKGIKGEFSLKIVNNELLSDTLNITNGKFNCHYQFFK